MTLVSNWKDFEVLAADTFDSLLPPAVITHNLIIKDKHGIPHQIDVDIRVPPLANPLRIMLDTKLWKKKVGKGEIQKLAKTRDQLGYDLAGVVANRLAGFSKPARHQAKLDDVRIFDLSHWLVTDTEHGQFGVTGGGPFSEEFIAGTRVVEFLPAVEGPLFHHPECAPGCALPNTDWITEAGATVGDTIRHWVEDGTLAVLRDGAINEVLTQAGQLDQGTTKTFTEIRHWDQPTRIRDPGEADIDDHHVWFGYTFRIDLRVLPDSVKHGEWFLRRLDDGEWRLLALMSEKARSEVSESPHMFDDGPNQAKG